MEAARTTTSPTTESDRPSILVVDDDSFMLSLITRLLSSKGYRVFQADHGDAAVEIARREPLDLILLDLMLTGEDGYSVCRRIKELPNRHQIPVIFLSGMRDEQAIGECLAAGEGEFLIKPFEPGNLLSRVKVYTEGSGPGKGADSR